MGDAHVYRTEVEIEEVVRRFEECSYSPEEFVHAKHLIVTAWYFTHLEPEPAREQMRRGLRKFIQHHGKNGYHETITEFWLRLVERRIRDSKGSEVELVGLVNEVIAQFHDKNLIYEHYSRERLGTSEAKARWLEPDLGPIG